MIRFLNHISEYALLTDDEIVTRTSGVFGIDAEEVLNTMIERDLCKSILNNILNNLKGNEN
jgi:hypothetical protein